MRIFQDVFSDEEIISDSYKLDEIYDGVAYQVKSRYVIKQQDNVNIGCGDAFGGKQEEQNGGNQAQKVIDVIDNFHYEETSFDKAGFQAYFKGYMKKILTYLSEKKSDRVEDFKKGARDLFKYICDNFPQFTFYTPPNYDMQNLIIMSYFKQENDQTPTFIYVKDGLKFYKV